MPENVHRKAKARANPRSSTKVKAKEKRKEAKAKAKVKQNQTKSKAKAKQHPNSEAVGHVEDHISVEIVRKGQHQQRQSEASPVFGR